MKNYLFAIFLFLVACTDHSAKQSADDKINLNDSITIHLNELTKALHKLDSMDKDPKLKQLIDSFEVDKRKILDSIETDEFKLKRIDTSKYKIIR